jgi:putative PIN family toxin of toxin-antitoxin system
LKVVLDTNVLISGIFFAGSPSKILDEWNKGTIEFVLSPEILREYTRVAGILSTIYPKIDINHIINHISSNSEMISTSPLSEQICDDPDDDMFLACALSSKCMIVISGDKHLLKQTGYQKVVVLTPKLFIEKYLIDPIK